ncbi:hypothetical protein [Rhodococcus rhodnii]|uniref:hypothetical protein n=1 Tax=Rhodococcus rhodnii TaxID=38312 RepID=UPI000934091B|nr:hypothetical protein [Rhodococcus rhodnii]
MHTDRTRPRRRLVVAAAVAAATALLLGGCGSDDSAPAPSNPAAAADTTSAPGKVTWSDYRGVTVPKSTVDGPFSMTAAMVPTGYARTPQGAVLAAMQGQTRLALTPDESWSDVAQTVLTFGPGRDAYAVARTLTSITEPADPASTAQFAGFRVEHFDGDTARIQLATALPDATLVAQPTELTWYRDDWRITLPDPATNLEDPDTGAVATDPVPLDSLDGYTRFAAQEQ